MTLLPAILPPVALGVAMVLAGQPSTIFITSAALASSMAVAVGISTVLSRRDEAERERTEHTRYAAARRQYELELALADAACRAQVDREARVLRRTYPAPPAIVDAVDRRSPTLWERRPADADFLDLRLGTGRRPTCLRFPQGAAASDPLARALVDRYATLEEMPLTAPLRAGKRAGIFGNREAVTSAAGWLALQVAALHSPQDVSLAVLSRDEGLCAWAKWLPHCRITQGERTQYLVGRTGGEASAALRTISDDLRSRASETEGRHHVVICDARDWESLSRRVARWLPVGDASLSLILIEDRFEQLSGDCDWVLDLTVSPGRLLRSVEPGEVPAFILDELAPDGALRAALRLTSLNVPEAEMRIPIPRATRTAEILGAELMTATGITEAWNAARSALRLSAPVGIGPNGAMVDVDLRRDGPHGLLAGTTGSGKSELLQSLVVSLAARVPPDLLNFVLIDYKGGSAFAEITTLPHVVGAVTDLDQRTAARALTSLRAEMQRRERLLAAAVPAATNVIEYQAAARHEPLANLVIIIDEFHRMIAEHPDFIDEMVRIAQQGRSLGVHLLLSTQKPSGVVTDQIRANTNLRICLRVTDEADSRDVLGGPEAAAIPRDVPGRVYIRSGNEAPLLCQAGRISGLVPVDNRGESSIVAVPFMPPLAGAQRRRNGVAAVALARATAESPADDDSAPVQLRDERATIVEAIVAAAVVQRIPAQSPPWREELPAVLALPVQAAHRTATDAGQIVIGLLDEPELQRQRPFVIDLDGGHVLIAGGANTGKTSALLTIASAAASGIGPEQLHLYGIDFAGGGLAPLAALPHCGGVAAQHEGASVEWVLQALKDIVAERLARTTTGSRSQQARVLVLVDNFSALWAALQTSDSGQADDDDLIEVMDLGRSVGVTFAVSVERPEALRPALLAIMHTRLALALTDPDGYSALGLGRPAAANEVILGRVLVPGLPPHEVHLALPGALDGPASLVARPSQGGPLRIAPLPVLIRRDDLLLAGGEEGPGAALLLGLREGTRPRFAYPAGEHLVVLGPRRSGRSNALAVALAECRRLGVARASIINPRRSQSLNVAATMPPYIEATRYAERAPDIAAIWSEIVTEAEERFAAYAAGEDPSLDPWVIVFDDADVLEIPPDATEVLQQLVLRGPDVGVTIMFAADTHALRAVYPVGVTRALLNLRAGILLVPTTPEDFDFFGVRGRPSRMPPGRGYFCAGGERHAVQIATL